MPHSSLVTQRMNGSRFAMRSAANIFCLSLCWENDGESKNKRPIFYFRLKNGQVLVEENNTNSDIVGELIELGVEKQDIVLASRSQQGYFALA